MSLRKTSPQLHPYGRYVSTKAILFFILFIIVLVLFIGGIPLFEILVGCCLPNIDRPQRTTPTIWQVAAPFWIISCVIGFWIAYAFIKDRVHQGKWLSPPDEVDKSSLPPVPVSFTTGRYIGGAILSLIFLISIVIGTAIIYSLSGFLTGGAVAFLLRFIQDLFLDLGIFGEPNGEVTQQSMQRFLECEYGSVRWALLKEARKDPQRWRQQVNTQQGLEDWAKETCKQLGYPPRPGHIERQAKKRRKIR